MKTCYQGQATAWLAEDEEATAPEGCVLLGKAAGAIEGRAIRPMNDAVLRRAFVGVFLGDFNFLSHKYLESPCCVSQRVLIMRGGPRVSGRTDYHESHLTSTWSLRLTL